MNMHALVDFDQSLSLKEAQDTIRCRKHLSASYVVLWIAAACQLMAFVVPAGTAGFVGGSWLHEETVVQMTAAANQLLWLTGFFVLMLWNVRFESWRAAVGDVFRVACSLLFLAPPVMQLAGMQPVAWGSFVAQMLFEIGSVFTVATHWDKFSTRCARSLPLWAALLMLTASTAAAASYGMQYFELSTGENMLVISDILLLAGVSLNVVYTTRLSASSTYAKVMSSESEYVEGLMNTYSFIDV